MIKRLFSHTIIYGFAPQIVRLANFFVLPVITQDLTEVDFGVAGVITAYSMSIAALSMLGLRVVLTNSFYHHTSQFKWGWKQLYGFLILWNLVYAVILGLLMFVIVPEEALDHRWTIVLLNVVPVVLFGPTAEIGMRYYQLKQKPVQVVWRSVMFGTSGILLNLYFISSLKMGYMGWFWSAFIVSILLNLSYLYPVNFRLGLSPIFNFKRRFIKRSLSVGLPTIPHYYSGFLLSGSDRMMMDLMKVDSGDIGKYNAAYAIGNMMDAISVAAGKAVGPLMMDCYRSGEEKNARDMVMLLQALFLGGTFLLCIWLKELFGFLLRNEVLAAMYSLGVIIVMSFNYRPIYYGYVNKLFFKEKTGIVWRVTLTAGLTNVILNIFLIPAYGFEVAAYTTFGAYMIMGYGGYVLKAFRKINNENYYPLSWFVSTIIATILAVNLVEANFALKLWVSSGVVALFVFFGLRYRKT